MKTSTALLTAALLASFTTQAAHAGDDDPFEVVKTVPGCNYFIAETPSWSIVAEDWTCPMPDVGDRGTGDLIGYFARHVTLNGMQCDLWVETWGGQSEAESSLADKCD